MAGKNRHRKKINMQQIHVCSSSISTPVQPDETGARPLSTERWPIRMERTADGWRVSEFHVPY